MPLLLSLSRETNGLSTIYTGSYLYKEAAQHLKVAASTTTSRKLIRVLYSKERLRFYKVARLLFKIH
jgi:hypothetical protein